MKLAPPPAVTRVRLRVEGTVQGVGFRPYVYRLAGELGLAGFVLNDAHGVVIEAEGDSDAVHDLLARLEPEAPPLAEVERVVSEPLAPAGGGGFRILASAREESADAPIAADTATCEDCLRELFDPQDRRYRYPFINCTNCGPRFTIVTGIPYDRPLTTMRGFGMCAACRREYEDPADRRFHAQPNACPDCGPSLSLVARDGKAVRGDPLDVAAGALLAGQIVAIKGIGGFHLACRADDQAAVARLRARKHREDKPFALMAASPAAADALVELGSSERELLSSAARPIVLAARRPQARVADAVAPGFAELGVMLPYSPLHHLLLSDCAPGAGSLVMTSGNVSDEPIAYRDGDAAERLAEIADLFLVHDRPIHTRTDDSVVRVVDAPRRRAMLLRRSRGYVPASVPLPEPGTPEPVLACGAQLKNTFCVARGQRAWVSHHVGDLENYETLRSFTEGVEHFKGLFAVNPRVIAHDLHPEYLSTKYALEQEGVRLVGVQHHHAHLAGCLAEHGEPGPAIGAIFDGTGYGTDGTLWGGELLYGDACGFTRAGSLEPVRLPGGQRAIREPWRMACAWLLHAHGAPPPVPAALAGQVDGRSWRRVSALAEAGLNSPLTTSAGRLFDAVATLCGIRPRVSYEGQAAIELEAACVDGPGRRYEIALRADDEALRLDPRPMLDAILRDLRDGVAIGLIASGFHTALAHATARGCARLAGHYGCGLVVLSGGVFQNRRLLEAAAAGLERFGLRVLMPQRLPANDGGISYGQAAIAARALAP